MNVSLLRLHRRHQPAVCAPAPGHCTCTIHHPVTAAERVAVADAIVLARMNGDELLVGYLQARLDTPCRTSTGRSVADSITCPCGCERRPWEHNPHLLERRAAA